MSTANAATNGVAKSELNGAAPKAADTATVKTLPTVKPKKEEPDFKPLEDRIFRLNQLRVLQDKYNRLKRSLSRLEEFELDVNNETATLSFQDDKRNSFSTSNKDVLPEMLEFLKKRIEQRIKAIEPLLNW